MAQVYGSLGLWEPALGHALAAFDAAPGNLRHLDMVASYYNMSGDHAGFRRFVATEYDKIDKLAPTRHSPTNKTRYFWHGYAAVLEGSYEQALADLTDAAGGAAGIENAVYDQITPLKYMAYALQRLGRSDEANAVLQQCLVLATEALGQGWATPTIHYRIAQIHALLHQPDAAIERLRQAVAAGWLLAGELENDPLWSALQDDVRFQALVAQVNDELRIFRERIPAIMGGA
jgi:tetratricopeptide (TPR) repeat protein